MTKVAIKGTGIICGCVVSCLQALNDREEFAASALACQDSEIEQYPLLCIVCTICTVCVCVCVCVWVALCQLW